MAVALCACRQLLDLDDLRGRTSATPDLADATDAPSAPVEGGNACTTTTECTGDAGRTSLCIENRCVALKQELCPLDAVLPGPEILQDPAALLFAAFVPFFDGHPASNSEGQKQAFKLAISEVNGPGVPGTPIRKVGLLLCDGAFSNVEKSVSHVVEDLHVPGVIAGFQPTDLTLFATNYFGAKEDGGAFKHPVFVVNPNPPAATLRYYKEEVGGMVMNLLGPAEDLAAVYTPLVAKAADYLAAPGSFRESQPATRGELRVAMVHEKGEPYYDELAETLRKGPLVSSQSGLERDAMRALRFNDRSLEENAGRFEYIPVELGAGYEEAATKLAEFKPDIIIALTIQQIDFANNQFSGLVPRVDEELLKVTPQAMPLWILRNAQHVVPFLQQINTGQRHLQRFVGVTYASAVDGAEERAKWLARMGTQYDPATANEWSWTENFYDAVYWLVYGYYAAKSSGTRLSGGEALSVAIQGKLLQPDPTVVVRAGEPAFVQSQFPIIRDNPKVMFRGALGDSKIPFSTMTWESSGSVYCFWVNGYQVDIRYDHLRYNRADGGLYEPPYDGGSPSCF